MCIWKEKLKYNKERQHMKNVIYIMLLIVILIGVLLMLGNKENKQEKIEIVHVSMNEIVKIMNESSDYIVLDVRTIEEYNQGHIPNAICIPNETIDESIIYKLPNKEQLILIYCRSGNRSKQAATKLVKLGYTNLVEFGGIIYWDGEIEK